MSLINIRHFEKRDFQNLINCMNSPDYLLQWAGPVFQYPLTEEQLNTHLDKTKGQCPSIMAFTATNEMNHAIGHFELSKIDYRNLNASISRVLIYPQQQGKGFGEHLVKEVLEIAFKKLNLHRVDLRVFDFNKPAIRCYEKVGFKKEGILKDARKNGSEFWSLLQYSCLENEWNKI